MSTMSYTIKKLPKSEVQIEITVPQEDIEKYYKKACEELSKEVNVKGFRPGHIPQDVLEANLDKKYIMAHAQEMAIQRSYADAVIAEKVQVVSRPKIEIKSETPFSYIAIVAVLPEVEIKDHKSIKVKREEVKVTEKDIEEVMEDLKKYTTTYKDSEEKGKKGDRMEVDFEGFDEEGKLIENTKSTDHPVILGENSLIPGFEDELIGLKKGEKKEFDLTFPKDYPKKDFQGKKVHFKIEVKRMESAIEPEINEEFIEKITGKKMPSEEFKKEIEKNVKDRKENEAKQKVENEYLEELLKRTKVEIPASLIEEEVEFMIHDIADDMGSKGIEFDKYLEKTKIKIEDLKEKYAPEAEKRVKMRLALQQLIKEEEATPTEDEIKAEFEKVKSFYPEKEVAKITEDFEKGELKAQITNRLAIRKLFDKVLG
ncbi:trigger factor [Candidatus Peregrinibacteria bacterium CG_4_10_14_0_2_um_filter_38_24]|nr:MAG: trigger factor [Candidatus Peregrinibacteria bacterium CG_4_10_14_0_2_um_filter_38_24]PJC39219.1 MAG: trigger factor [Candidatus Peregrinibacteria bacterium CG_4_9_14_0_2_um_filter_38_9]